MWEHVSNVIDAGAVVVTQEIYLEMVRIPGIVGSCVKRNRSALVLEIGEGDWDWEGYVEHTSRMQRELGHLISEFNGGSKRTIGLNDLSIIALEKTLELPVVSMEAEGQQSEKKARIPQVCAMEKVERLRFNDFLERVKFKNEWTAETAVLDL